MAHYAVGSFKPSRSGSPSQFVSTDLQPKGPFAKLDLNRLKIKQSQFDWVHHRFLFELEDWRSANQSVQYVTKLITSLRDVRAELHQALKGATWEMVQMECLRRKIQIVGEILKTKYGYFRPEYHSGLNAFGPGQDVDPWITFEPCPVSTENPYGDAWMAVSEREYLCCVDEAEIKRAHDAGIANGGLGELLAAKMSQQGK